MLEKSLKIKPKIVVLYHYQLQDTGGRGGRGGPDQHPQAMRKLQHGDHRIVRVWREARLLRVCLRLFRIHREDNQISRFLESEFHTRVLLGFSKVIRGLVCNTKRE